jgi:hypothetical protein
MTLHAEHWYDCSNATLLLSRGVNRLRATIFFSSVSCSLFLVQWKEGKKKDTEKPEGPMDGGLVIFRILSGTELKIFSVWGA